MTTSEATTSRRTPPQGREAIVAAVLDSATALFAERGPTATSIRDIAERAGVNHGLVFRHFGAKDKLVAEVLDHLGAGHADRELSSTDTRLSLHWTVIARCLLDGYPAGELQHRFPVMNRLFQVAQQYHDERPDAALAAAHAAALELGWQLFGPFLRSAAGLDELTLEQLQAAADERARRILTSGL
ncbi:helix-turn-helix domain-containing protein [Nocardia sp. NPDC059239]|uniref:helix-turn-helix domain-containing protein n=1 Tax=unclassified Nocardia TaxID=2637762 RepID=UPI00369E6ED1